MSQWVQVNIKFSPRWADALQLAARADECLPATIRRLASIGLCQLMAEGSKPISRRLMDALTAKQVFRLWTEYQDAVASEAGQKGILGNLYRFAEVPVGTHYGEPGRPVYHVLREDEILGKDGLIYARKEWQMEPRERHHNKEGHNGNSD